MSEAFFLSGAALIVGGSGGVGQAVCREFARAGTDIALTYHKKRDTAERLAEEIRGLGCNATIHQLTLGDAAGVEAVVAAAAQAHRRLHTVVVGAATLTTQVLISELSAEQWNTVVTQLSERVLLCSSFHAAALRKTGAVDPTYISAQGVTWHGRIGM